MAIAGGIDAMRVFHPTRMNIGAINSPKTVSINEGNSCSVAFYQFEKFRIAMRYQ